jgi:hypothetical protein
MGNIDGIKVNRKCLRIFSALLRDFLELMITRGGENLTPGRLLIRQNDRRGHVSTP